MLQKNLEIATDFDMESCHIIEALRSGIPSRAVGQYFSEARPEIMRDIMFDIPSNEKIEKCIITKNTVIENAGPRIIENPNKVKRNKAERIAVEEKETA